MDIHKTARLTFVRREQLAESVILQGLCSHRRQMDTPLPAARASWFTRPFFSSSAVPLPHC